MSSEKDNSPINYNKVPEEFFYGLKYKQTPLQCGEVEVISKTGAIILDKNMAPVIDPINTTIKTSATQD